MSIDCKVIADSISFSGKRITTLQLRYPRFIHSELMTHRVFSRNASSSRAIPVGKMISMMKDDPATPIHWGMNQSGMQASVEATGSVRESAVEIWQEAMLSAIGHAEELIDLGIHKQVANRILEPFAHITTLVTATEWENWFELRSHEDAQPEIRALSDLMLVSKTESLPQMVAFNEEISQGWHLPFISNHEKATVADLDSLLKASAARCARVSYLTHAGKTPDIDTDIKLYDRLIKSKPVHASPVEHQARPLFSNHAQSRNFVGWKQFRDQLGV